jgi:hypothetical protein
MNIFFFTYVDRNPKYRAEADLLIRSGRRFGREIHLFEIPEGAMWNRYKVELLAAELPAADRYVCLDSDTILTGPGDWEAGDCQGVMDILYYMDPPDRDKHTKAFIRNHTLLEGDPGAYEAILQLWRKWQCPIWPNSGVVVLDAEVRLPFARRWQEWMTMIDGRCNRGYVVGDEAPCMFARQDFGLPLLPPRFNGCCKWQPIHDWHVLLHADGNVNGAKRIPYNLAVESLLEYEKQRA